MLWRPSTVNTVIKRGEEGDDIRWLRQALNFVAINSGEEVAALSEGSEFTEDLEARIIKFQESNEIGERGIVGAETLIALNSLLDSGMPRLTRF